MADVYNYQKALKQDIVIRKISDTVSLPVGIKIKPALIFLITLGMVYFLFHGFVSNFYGKHPDLGKIVALLFYVGMPWGVTWYLGKLKVDGLNIVEYLLSVVAYGFRLLTGKTWTYHDQSLTHNAFQESRFVDDPVLIFSTDEEK